MRLLFGYLLCLPALLSAQPVCYVVGHSDSIVLAQVRGGARDERFPDFLRARQCRFAGTPYGSGGKGSQKGQTLVNLEQMDCLTYVENLLALYITRRMLAYPHAAVTARDTLNLFARNLNYIRYDRGINCEWEDRLFYFTGAMAQLAGFGILDDVSAIAGEPYTKRIHYVSSHRSSYPGIRNWAQVLRLEQELSSLRRSWYPTAQLGRYQLIARDGDIIAFASTLEGLDISHVGFVLRDTDGSLWLNHSSSVSKRIECQQDLCEYLAGRKTVNGFFVYRFVW
ncbi:MAG: DUF1460 domain-containing protein [Bacteroidetes bacterium]|nr:DUF1460 domain-containing protein [Bacteroidota bacterium]